MSKYEEPVGSKAQEIHRANRKHFKKSEDIRYQKTPVPCSTKPYQAVQAAFAGAPHPGVDPTLSQSAANLEMVLSWPSSVYVRVIAIN